MDKLKVFRQRLRDAVGSNAKSIAGQSGGRLNERTLRRWLADDAATPQAAELMVLAECLNTTPGWFFDEEPAAALQGDPDDVVRIPYLDVALSAGGGRVNAPMRGLDLRPWPLEMIKAMGAVDKIQCLRCEGHSMEPGILDGAVAFVERTENKLAPRRRGALKADIYAVVFDNHALVKRVSEPAPGFRAMISDNTDFEPLLRAHDKIEIVGRVVGWINRPAI